MKKLGVFLFGTVLVLAFQNCGGGFEKSQSDFEAIDANSVEMDQDVFHETPHENESSAGAPLVSELASEAAPEIVSPPVLVANPLPTLNVLPPVAPPTVKVNAPAAQADASIIKVWVVRADQSNVTIIGGGRALSQDATELNGRGVTIYNQNKYLNIKSGTTAAQTLSLMNGFEIAQADLSKASAAGFAQLGSQLAAVSCAGKEALMIFGQSNSANSATAAEIQILPRTFMFYNGYCYPARDPLLGGTIHSVGAGGSVGWRIAKLYQAKYPTKDVVIFSFGYGGSSINDWNSTLASRLTTALQLAKSVNLNVTKIFWHQGETDTINNTSEQAYYDSFLALKSKVRASGLTSTFYIAVASAMSFRPHWVSTKVQNAQYRLIETQSDIELGAETDILGTSFRSHIDGLHLNATGTTEVARQFFDNAFNKVVATNATMVSSYYRTYLNRTPSSSEVSYWTGKLQAGQTLAQVRAAIRDSDEGFAREMYRSYANRLASQEELNYWMLEAQTKGRSAADQSFRAAVTHINNNGSYDASLYDLIPLGSVYNVLGLQRVLQPRLASWNFDQTNGVWIRK